MSETTNVKNEPMGNESIVEASSDIKQEANESKESIGQTSSTIAAPPRRTFVPNLSIDRSKKDTTVKTEETRHDKSSGRRQAQPNLNASRASRGRNQQNLIQSHSIFEAGPAESLKRYGSHRPNQDDSFTRTIGSTSSSDFSNKSIKKENSGLSTKLEESLLIEDYKEEESPVYVKLKYDYKQDKDVVRSDTTRLEKAKLETDFKDIKTLSDLFMNETNSDKLVLFQIPENLKLQDLEDGHIGKLRIRKSGRIELCIDNEKLLNLSLSVSGPFLQEAVALQLNNNESMNESARLTNLGKISNKVVCSPKLF